MVRARIGAALMLIATLVITGCAAPPVVPTAPEPTELMGSWDSVDGDARIDVTDRWITHFAGEDPDGTPIFIGPLKDGTFSVMMEGWARPPQYSKTPDSEEYIAELVDEVLGTVDYRLEGDLLVLDASSCPPDLHILSGTWERVTESE